jgi:hypothetical protein
MGADCHTDHHMVVENVREKLAVSEQTTHKFHIERFNLKNLTDEVEGKEQYQVDFSNKFAALKNLYGDADINRASETVRENIKISGKNSLGYKLKKYKPWFDEKCSKLVDQRKQDKLQWLQGPSQINGNNFINVRCETSRNFRNRRKREYRKDKINEPATNNKNKNIRDMYRGVN